MKRSVAVLLQDIVDAVRLIQQGVAGVSLDSFTETSRSRMRSCVASRSERRRQPHSLCIVPGQAGAHMAAHFRLHGGRW